MNDAFLRDLLPSLRVISDCVQELANGPARIESKLTPDEVEARLRTLKVQQEELLEPRKDTDR